MRAKLLGTLIVAVGIAALAVSRAAFAAEIAAVPWDESHLQTLQSFDKSAVVQFLNDNMDGLDGFPITDVFDDIKYSWSDFDGNGKYELIVLGTTRCCGGVMVFSKDATGNVSQQNLDGWTKLNKGIRDLNGDGKKELIVASRLETDDYRGAKPGAAWTAIYRFKDGKLIEASRDFPRFFDTEELPWYENEIAKDRKELAKSGPATMAAAAAFFRKEKGSRAFGLLGQEEAVAVDGAVAAQEGLAADEMGRDKILRVLGRDPKAGEKEAYEWMKNPDPELRIDAAVVFADIGGHDRELRSLEADKVSYVAISAKFAQDSVSRAKK